MLSPASSSSDASISHPVASSKGIIHVLGYTPTEGERGIPITVRIHFDPGLAEAIYVRLVVGHKAVATKVRELPGATYGRWQLDANVPAFDEREPSTKVLISVQALNESDTILDSVTFGEFSYWAPQRSPHPISDSKSSTRDDVKASPYASPIGPALRRRSLPHLSTHSPSMSSRPLRSNHRERKTRLHRRLKSQSLIRSKLGIGSDSVDDLCPQTPILDLVTPLGSLCVSWSPAEISAGRRLVRFGKVQEGRRLIVSCEPISQEEYCESDSVISCIYREETKSCYVTSVDIIYLLERLTNDDFPVEEKNRIRRNLEGLRPTTVSKHKQGFEDFFQRIMEFPDPKPRNIEKDLKVFEWPLLGQALEKILSKYTIYTAPECDSDRSSPVGSSPPAQSPEFVYPADFTCAPYSGTPTKYQGVHDDLPLFSAEADDAQYRAMAGVPASYISQGSSDSSSGSWVSDLKPGEIAFDAYGNITTPYEPIEHALPLEEYREDSNYALSYEQYGFHPLSDDALAGMVEQYIS